MLMASGEQGLRGTCRLRAAADVATDRAGAYLHPIAVDAADRVGRSNSSRPQGRLRDLPIARRIDRAGPRAAVVGHRDHSRRDRGDQSEGACACHERAWRFQTRQAQSRCLVLALLNGSGLVNLIDAHLGLRHERVHHHTAERRDDNADGPEAHQPPTPLHPPTRTGVDQLEMRARAARRQASGRARLQPVRYGPAGSECGSTRNALWRARHDVWTHASLSTARRRTLAERGFVSSSASVGRIGLRLKRRTSGAGVGAGGSRRTVPGTGAVPDHSANRRLTIRSSREW